MMIYVKMIVKNSYYGYKAARARSYFGSNIIISNFQNIRMIVKIAATAIRLQRTGAALAQILSDQAFKT